MTISTRLSTFFCGKLVGTDAFGNRYYRAKRRRGRQRERRWVLFNGLPEPSKVPAEWHGWLHHTTDDPPAEVRRSAYRWEKQHLPNLTGTVNAYAPPGHLLRGADRAATTSDYEPWQP